MTTIDHMNDTARCYSFAARIEQDADGSVWMRRGQVREFLGQGHEPAADALDRIVSRYHECHRLGERHIIEPAHLA